MGSYVCSVTVYVVSRVCVGERASERAREGLMCTWVQYLQLYVWVCLSGSIQLCVCVQLSLCLHACEDMQVCVCLCGSTPTPAVPGAGVCLCAHALRLALCSSLCQELNWLLAVSGLSGCVCGGVAADPLRSLQVSGLEACDCGHWCHCGYLPPTSAFSWVFTVTAGSVTGHGVPVGLSCWGSLCTCVWVRACVCCITSSPGTCVSVGPWAPSLCLCQNSYVSVSTCVRGSVCHGVPGGTAVPPCLCGTFV